MKYKVDWEENATQEVAAEFVTGKDKVATLTRHTKSTEHKGIQSDRKWHASR